MRVLHVLHSHGYGGAENHCLMLMRAQREAGHEVAFAGPLDSWLGRACAEAGIAAHHIAMHGLYDPVSHWRLRRLVARLAPDVVHGHLIRGAQYAGHAQHGSPRCVAVCTAHATTARTHMRRCRHVIAVSEAVKRNLCANGYDADLVTVVHNGVPDVRRPDRRAVRRELGIAEEAFVAVNAGRFIPDKGQALLVDAARMLPAPIEIALIGDPQTDYGREVRRAAGDGSQVHFVGYRRDAPDLLGAFDAYVLSSHREALPLSIVEAMAAGLPIVATRVGGVPEIVVDGVTGMIVEPGRPEALAGRLRELAADSALAARLGAAAREAYERELTLQHMVHRTMAVYERVRQQAARCGAERPA